MTHDSSPPSDDRNPVDLLADEFAARLRSGESPSMQEYVDRYPEHAAEIESLFPGVALLEQLSDKQESESSYAHRRPQNSLPPGHRFEDIELIREIGRGGMGIVYEAYQHSLNRSVAVKAISGSSLLSPNQLARFQREAQAAAQLHHTNIVPVFGVGEQDGISFYVMQLIHGLGLDAILTELARKTRDQAPRRRATDESVDSFSARDLADVLVSGQLSESTVRGAARVSTFLAGRDPDPTAAFSPQESAENGQPELEHRSENRTEDRTGEMCEGDTPTPYVRSSLVLRDEVPEEETFAASPSEPDQATADPALESLGSRYWRNIARIGLQVASGLQYAHAQGTLHRDVKPANILLDTEGTAWIADFGLAKLLEQEDVTKTGDVVGTLRYMAPEQFRGHADARSDIYSLGLTLYELLTLRPAYDDTDRQKLIARKLTPHDPPAPRRFHPGIPRDLETIVLKCLSFERDGRYQSAGAVVSDLQAFLGDRPIMARRISPAERFWRWCKRNPVIAWLSTAVLALLVVIVVLTSTGYYVAQNRADRMAILKGKADEAATAAQQSATEADLERAAAEEARANTEQIVDLQWQALDAIYDAFVPDRFAGPVEASVEDDETGLETESTATVLSPQTAAMLERMLTSYDQIAEIRGTDARFLEKTAKANQKVGDLRLRLGQHEQAVEAFDRAVNRFRELEAMNGPTAETSLDLARLHSGLSIAHGSLGNRDESRNALRKSIEILSQPTVDHSDPTIRYERAVALFLMAGRPEFGRRGGGGRGGPSPGRGGPGREQRRSDGEEGSLRDDQRAQDRSDQEPRETNRDGRRRDRRRFGTDPAERRQHFQAALEILEPLIEEHPTVPEYQFLSALCHLELSHPWMAAADDPVEDRLSLAIDILKELVAAHPTEPDFLYQLSEAYEQRYYRWRWSRELGTPFLMMVDFNQDSNSTDFDQAASDLREAVRLSKVLLRQQPNVPRYSESHMSLLFNLADLSAARRELSTARELLEDAAEHRQSLQERFPETAESQGIRGFFSDVLLARVLLESERPGEARDLLQRLIDRRTAEVSDQEPRRFDPFRREFLRPVYSLLAQAHEALGDAEAAEAALKQVESLPENPFARPPQNPQRASPGADDESVDTSE